MTNRKHLIAINPEDAAPLWRQIEEGIQHLVASRRLSPGSAVPSVRELAQELQVNPATVSKAYQRLKRAGTLEVRRGEGTFVAQTPPTLKEEERRNLLQEGARRYANLAVSLGWDLETAVETLADAFWQLKKEQGEDS